LTISEKNDEKVLKISVDFPKDQKKAKGETTAGKSLHTKTTEVPVRGMNTDNQRNILTLLNALIYRLRLTWNPRVPKFNVLHHCVGNTLQAEI